LRLASESDAGAWEPDEKLKIKRFLLEQVCNLLRNVYDFFAGAGLQPAP
jgi:hypothetical protein